MLLKLVKINILSVLK